MTFAPEVKAQMTSINASKIIVKPEYPKAYEQVTISIEDYSIDLNTQTMSWAVNGAQKQSGIGLKTYTFSVGALGTSYKVSVSAGSKSYNVTVRPTEVDVIWEAADSYVPPFYEGKALFPNQGMIIVSAIPHIFTSEGTRLDPKNLVYKWKKAGGAVPDQSGYGKDSIVITGAFLGKPTTYSVEISSMDGAYKAFGTAYVEETRPVVTLYENDPLYGVEYERAFNDKTIALEGDEMELTAVPYFFSTNASFNPLSFIWSMNNGKITNNTAKSITLRREGANGFSTINVMAKHATNVIQMSRGKTTIDTTGNN